MIRSGACRAYALFVGMAVLSSLPAGAAAAATSAPSPVDFVRDVQPLFAAHCYTCHGPKNQKGLLRFDSKPSVLQGGQSGLVIQPGESDKSRLVHRVLGLDNEQRMPLHDKPLSGSEVAILKAWIDQGAPWPDSASVAGAQVTTHWSYLRLVRPDVPQVRHANWCRNPIDNFVAARLEREGLEPSAEADRYTLIRRVSLDLIGLPPTPREVDEFVNDKSPNAYDALVERLLSSPHYGERWATPWLDLARYADSQGYERDHLRSMWPYRDWVINALNRDMPFDQFTVEQLAGDLLPNATLEQKVATGFHRNTMINQEAGSDQGEFFYYALVDRVNTTASVWLGTTLACAQCHNHKYDPFTQRDYYQLMAYFNGTADEGRQVGGSEIEDISPKLTVESSQVRDLKAKIARLQEKLAAPTPELAASQADWERQVSREIHWKPLEITEAVSKQGVNLTWQPDGSIRSTGKLPNTDTYVLTATTDLARITAIRLEVLPDDADSAKGPGRASNGNFVLTHIGLSATPAESGHPSVTVGLQNASADFSQDGWAVEKALGATSDPNAGWGILPAVGRGHFAVFETASDVGSEGGSTLQISLEQESGAAQHLIGRLRMWVTADSRPVSIPKLPVNIAAIVAVPSDHREPKQKEELAAYYRTIAPALQPLRDELSQLEARVKEQTGTTLVMQEMPEPRETHIHVRGAYLVQGEKVSPGLPALFSKLGEAPPSPVGARPTRLDLARWLVGPDNPLTARVTANRIWEQYFGVGIAKTSDDLGTQGEPPSDPELLDWLACELQSRGWSLKQLHRLIVQSATYRQSSDVTPALLEKDPYNRLMARGPRFRLPAELLRDQALAVGGLLSEKLGGPSVFPLQPEGIWNNPYSGDRWNTSPGEDRFRRGLYTFIRRSTPFPQFIAFDMTTREAICTRRALTNTPLQALTTLNDPAFIQPAAALARRAMAQGGTSTDERATFIFRSALARPPQELELRRLTALHDRLLKVYEQDSAAARQMATGSLEPLPDGLSVPDLASWTVVANTVLNLDETLSKG